MAVNEKLKRPVVDVNNATKAKIDTSKVCKIAEEYLSCNGIKSDLSIAFVTDRRMREINKAYRGQDKPTDVLSFAGGDGLFGEIILDLHIIKRNASERNKAWTEELYFILIHGLLHLSGMNDEDEHDRLSMIRKGEKLMAKFGLKH